MNALSHASQLVLMISAGLIGGLVLCYAVLARFKRRRTQTAEGRGLQALTDASSLGGLVFASSSLLGQTSSPRMSWAAVPSVTVVQGGAFWLALCATLITSGVLAVAAYRAGTRRRQEEIAEAVGGPTVSL